MLLKQPHNKPVNSRNFLEHKLEFTSTQKESFLALDKAHRKKMRGYDDEIKEYKNELFKLISNEKDLDNNLLVKLGITEKQKGEETFRFLTEVRNLCSEEQKENFDVVLENIIFSQKPPFRGHKPPQGHPPMREGHLPPPPNFDHN